MLPPSFSIMTPTVSQQIVEEHCSVEQSRRAQAEPISLDSCLRAFTSEEELGEDELYYCSKCKTHRLATKKLDLWRLPPILVSGNTSAVVDKSFHPLVKNMYVMAVFTSKDLYSSPLSVMKWNQTTLLQKTFLKFGSVVHLFFVGLHSFITSDVCLGSLSCWNTQLHTRGSLLLMILGFPEDNPPSSLFSLLSLYQQIHWQPNSPTA